MRAKAYPILPLNPELVPHCPPPIGAITRVSVDSEHDSTGPKLEMLFAFQWKCSEHMIALDAK